MTRLNKASFEKSHLLGRLLSFDFYQQSELNVHDVVEVRDRDLLCQPDFRFFLAFTCPPIISSLETIHNFNILSFES